MKRLFCVKNRDGKIISFHSDGKTPTYFDNKMKAKEARNQDYDFRLGYHISRGPDHMGKHGNKVRRMRLQPKHVNSYTGL